MQNEGTGGTTEKSFWDKVKSAVSNVNVFVDKVTLTPSEILKGEGLGNNSIAGQAKKKVVQESTEFVDQVKGGTVQVVSGLKKYLSILGVGLGVYGLYKIIKVVKS